MYSIGVTIATYSLLSPFVALIPFLKNLRCTQFLPTLFVHIYMYTWYTIRIMFTTCIIWTLAHYTQCSFYSVCRLRSLSLPLSVSTDCRPTDCLSCSTGQTPGLPPLCCCVCLSRQPGWWSATLHTAGCCRISWVLCLIPRPHTHTPVSFSCHVCGHMISCDSLC